MISEEEDYSIEYYEVEEENQMLIIQETSIEESSQDESENEKECDDICVCSYKSINLISKNSKTSSNIFIHNHLSLINSIYFQFWYIKDRLFRFLNYMSKNILTFKIFL